MCLLCVCASGCVGAGDQAGDKSQFCSWLTLIFSYCLYFISFDPLSCYLDDDHVSFFTPAAHFFSSWLVLPLRQWKLHYVLHCSLALHITPSPCGSVSCLMSPGSVSRAFPLVYGLPQLFYPCSFKNACSCKILSAHRAWSSSSDSAHV